MSSLFYSSQVRLFDIYDSVNYRSHSPYIARIPFRERTRIIRAKWCVELKDPKYGAWIHAEVSKCLILISVGLSRNKLRLASATRRWRKTLATMTRWDERGARVRLLIKPTSNQAPSIYRCCALACCRCISALHRGVQPRVRLPLAETPRRSAEEEGETSSSRFTSSRSIHSHSRCRSENFPSLRLSFLLFSSRSTYLFIYFHSRSYRRSAELRKTAEQLTDLVVIRSTKREHRRTTRRYYISDLISRIAASNVGR